MCVITNTRVFSVPVVCGGYQYNATIADKNCYIYEPQSDTWILSGNTTGDHINSGYTRHPQLGLVMIGGKTKIEQTTNGINVQVIFLTYTWQY